MRLRRVARVMPSSCAACTWLPWVSTQRLNDQFPLHGRQHLQPFCPGAPIGTSWRGQRGPRRAAPAAGRRRGWSGVDGTVVDARRWAGVAGGTSSGGRSPREDGIALGHHQRALDDVLQFAHIAGPGVVLQSTAAPRVKWTAVSAAVGRGELLQEIIHQQAECPRAARAAGADAMRTTFSR